MQNRLPLWLSLWHNYTYLPRSEVAGALCTPELSVSFTYTQVQCVGGGGFLNLLILMMVLLTLSVLIMKLIRNNDVVA